MLYSRLLFGDDRLLQNPELGTEPDNASQLACLFWNAHELNEYADDLDIDAISDQINIGRQTEKHGDAIGFAHREKLTRQLLEILA
jgi:predicted chitinase